MKKAAILLTAVCLFLVISVSLATAETKLLVNAPDTQTSQRSYIGIDVREQLSQYVGRDIMVSFDAVGSKDQIVSVYAYQSSGISIADKYACPLSENLEHYSFFTTVKDYGLKEGRSQGGVAFYDSESGNYTISNFRIDLVDAGAGKNILPGYELEVKTARGALMIELADALKPYVGQHVVVSFELCGGANKDIAIYAYQKNGVSIGFSQENSLHVPMTTNYLRYYFPTVVTDYGIRNETYTPGAMMFYDEEKNTPFSVRRVKIELGDNLTDWQPYLEGN